VHKAAAPRYAEAGIKAIDLTPAAVGPAWCRRPTCAHLDAPNVNMVTCGGQATIPMVYAVSRRRRALRRDRRRVSSCRPGRAPAPTSTSSPRPPPGVEVIGGAKRGKAIIILNPADPPMIMRDTIFCAIPEDADRDAITQSIKDVVAEVQTYVPGYRCSTNRSSTSRRWSTAATRGDHVRRGRGVPATICRPMRGTWTS
jgi:acetaldehyde dehydrogenase